MEDRILRYLLSNTGEGGILYVSDEDTLILLLDLLERDGWALEHVPDGFWIAEKDGRVLRLATVPHAPVSYYVGMEAMAEGGERLERLA